MPLVPDQPDISVVMGVYNGAELLSDTIESVLNQEFSDFEFIIVNDGSTDNTRTMLDKFAPSDQRIRLIQKDNEGLIQALIDHLSLYVDANFSGTASLNESWQGGEKGCVEVDVTTLDHLYEGGYISRVDVVKMDVEGWEYAVLEGAGKMLHATRPYVWFEHNLPMLQRSGIDANRVLDILQELGYDTFYDIGSLPESPSYSRRDIDELSDCRVNLLAVPIERDQDFNTRVQPAMRSLSDATGA